MLLAAIALALSLVIGGSTPSPSSAAPAAAGAHANYSQLPATQPGLSHDEGVFFVTTADDGSRAVYFIAGNARHSILWTDLQIELQLNPLWPVFTATSDQVLAYQEGAPIGAAKVGLIGGNAPAPAPEPAPAPAPAPEPAPAEPAPAPADAAPAAPAPAPSDDSQPATYTLRPGDNLTHIAAQYGTTIEAILDANGLPNANRIYAGQTLLIPSADTALADDAPAPAAADAPAPVANTPAAPKTDAPAPVADAPAAAPSADAPAPDAAAGDPGAEASDAADTADATTYTVQPGDSAFKIARNFGIAQEALLEANGISNPNRVYAGQVLTIPGSSS